MENSISLDVPCIVALNMFSASADKIVKHLKKVATRDGYPSLQEAQKDKEWLFKQSCNDLIESEEDDSSINNGLVKTKG
jgi:hypothetical protein